MLWKQPNKYKDFFTLVVIYALISWLIYQDNTCIDTEYSKVVSIMLFINAVVFTAYMYDFIKSEYVTLFGLLFINFLFFGYMDDNSLYC